MKDGKEAIISYRGRGLRQAEKTILAARKSVWP